MYGRKQQKRREQEEWEAIKRKFSLREGKLVEVSFIPQENFFDEISLRIQHEWQIRYYVLLKDEKISFITKFKNRIVESIEVDCLKTLDAQFTPVMEKDRN